MSRAVSSRDIGTARRWSMLGLSMLAQMSGTLVVNGTAGLIPSLHQDHGMSLARAGFLAGMPLLGSMLTLIAWGAVVDRYGERWVLAVGLGLTALCGMGVILATSFVGIGAFLFVGGMMAACVNAASGRVVIGWFPPEQRGLTMGIRQMAQPLGVGLGALTIPKLAATHGVHAAWVFPTAFVAVMAAICALFVIDPPRPSRLAAMASGAMANPYRQGSLLWRIHGVSILLQVPQIVIWNFALVWLIAQHGWSPTDAGLLVTVAQVLGALGRMLVGWISDRIGSRMRPLRAITVCACVVMLVLGLTDGLDLPVAVLMLVIASIVTVADNGLAFTSVAEIGGPYWGGRAMGIQNTGQFLVAALIPSSIGALIGAIGYPATFALTAIFPLIAMPVVPKTDRLEPVVVAEASGSLAGEGERA
ncbi:MAG: MFS transporter [Thermomicrobiales bacterium]